MGASGVALTLSPVKGQRVTVGTTVTTLYDNSDGAGIEYVTIRNRGTAAVDVGGSTVASGAGYELDNTDPALVVTIEPGYRLCAICATGTQRVDVLGSVGGDE